MLFNDGSLTNVASSHSFQHVNQNLVDVFQETSIKKRKHCVSVFLFILTFSNAVTKGTLLQRRSFYTIFLTLDQSHLIQKCILS